MLYYLTDSALNETSAAFRIEGPDANTYLQGQFTQDLNRPNGSVGYGLFLNQKGKVVADAHILRLGSDAFQVVSFSLAAAKLRERLEAYLIADEVNIADETTGWVRVSVWGNEAGAAVAKLTGAQPGGADVWFEGQNIRGFHGRSSAGENFELLVPRADELKIGEALKSLGAKLVDANAAARERITSGIPMVPVDIGLSDLPNEGGLDAVAISYTKGCYLGQEVMARLKNLGQVRRHLHIVRGKGAAPQPGALLFQNDHKVGDIRSVAKDGDDFVAMAMLSLVNFTATNGLSLVPNAAASEITLTRRV